MRFTKMHGLGNDFIIIDCRRRAIKNPSQVVKKLSRRRFAVGFDQAILLKGSRRADFRMEIYNNDGGRVEMCGNGIRCLASYIWKRGIRKKSPLEIETPAGIIRPEKAGKLIKVDMGSPVTKGRLIPVRSDEAVISRPFRVKDRTLKITCVSMGNPHCVIFVKDVDGFPVTEFGPIIERAKFFPKRTNVEFVEIMSRKRLKMRVWERGSGETLACGTGASAAAVAAHLNGLADRSVTVRLRGGNLKIHWSSKKNRVYMTGPAEEVFEGTVEI
ncbi:MAG: diaminopimelate epimerase [Thermodesulfobacteriota bacterium]